MLKKKQGQICIEFTTKKGDQSYPMTIISWQLQHELDYLLIYQNIEKVT
jgi:hypothetical protein